MATIEAVQVYLPPLAGAVTVHQILVGPQGVQGPQGETGPQGPAGATGSQGPAGAAGAAGPEGPAGAAGAAGEAGANGTDGKTVLNGSGAPSGGTGVDGDFYIDTTANAIYGPKTAGAWGSPTSLIGPQGETGATGDPGPAGDPAKPFLVFKPVDNEPPATNYATLDIRNGHPVLDFDTTTQEAAIFSSVLPASYNGGGLTVEVWWAATSATTGTIGWDVAIERIDTDSLDIDADSFATAQTITDVTVPATSGHVKKTSVSITSGANMDSLVSGEAFRVRVRRDVENDTATGDAELLRVVVRET